MPSATKEHKLLVFLSYAREDAAPVRTLYTRLKRDGFDPWMDEKRILGGQDWDLEIRRAMKRCDVILLCFSNNSLLKDGYIQRECKKAMVLQQDKPPGTIFVIPVRLDDCEIPEFLGDLHCLDYPRDKVKLTLALREREKDVLSRLTPGLPVVDKPVPENGAMEIVDRLFQRNDLDRLVQHSFYKPEELQEVLAETFPAGGVKQGTQEFTAEFIRYQEIPRLMGEIKKRNPEGYRDFLAARALAAIGLSPSDIPPVETDAKVIESELASLQRSAIAQQGAVPSNYLEFEDRELLFKRIRTDKNNHIVVHGISGTGKTHILNQLREKYGTDTRCVLIDLRTCKPKDILRLALKELGGAAKPSDEYQELARCIDRLVKKTRIRRFYFLFDNADHNQPAIDYLFSPENLIENPRLQGYLEAWELTGMAQLKIIIAALHPVHGPASIYPAFSNADQIKIEPLDQHSVQLMLEAIADWKKIPVKIGRIAALSDEVFYLTGGHPKCTKQMLLALAEQGCVMPTAQEWVQLYKEHVIATIHAEMLQPVDPRLLSTIWNLSIFRRFDQRLLGGLLERGLLPVSSGDISRQARELRTRLEQTSLFDTETETATIIPNYVMRNALALNLQVDAPGRYKALHAVALQMYLERFLSSEAGPEKRIERLAVNLLELLFHSARLLELELHRKGPRAKARPVCPRLRNSFDNYLRLALTMIRVEDQPDFFRTIQARWEADAELREAIQRCTPQEDCRQELQNLIQSYNHPQDGSE
jgi:hypothetical protein